MGQILTNCCKSKKPLRNEDGSSPGDVNPEDKPKQETVELKDYIFELQLEEGFKGYIEANFDMKDKSKYLMDEKLGLFTFDCLIKVFMASFVWKNICMDKAQGPFLQQRREFLKKADDENYKMVIGQLEKLEESIFQSCLVRVKTTVQLLEQNFQRSMSIHLFTEENQKKLAQIENSAYSYFM